MEGACRFASFAQAERLMGIPARRLRRWRRQMQTGDAKDPGRPACIITPPVKKLIYEQMSVHGPNVDHLWTCFCWLSRRAIAELVARVSRVRSYFQMTFQLRWLGAGKVWAMDCLQRETTEGENIILNVRDLSSGKVLASRLLRSQCMAEVLLVLQELFAKHGRPLVIKSDNGGEFSGICVREYLRAQEVVQLFSPEYYPQYNGACEAGGGWLVRRAGRLATEQGRPGELDGDLLEAARVMGNTARRRQRQTAEEEWAQREPITENERALFLELVQKEQLRAKKEISEIMESVKEKAPLTENREKKAGKEIDVERKSARIGIERALACAGVLQVRRSRFPIPINPK